MADHYTYDVFVSFRGEDSRYRFVSHLLNALARHRINTFKDTESLERGESISPVIKRSIHESRLSVIVFSKNYAFSTWCLEELVEIMHCKEDKGQIVLPIFLDVDPSEVSEQSGSFGEAFVEHEKNLGFGRKGIQQIRSWRLCLTKAAEIAGWDSRDNKHEAKFIEDIATEVMNKLTRIHSKQSSEIVGMDSRIEEIFKRLALADDNVRMVGLCGIRGVGKTTLARHIYNQISGGFNGFCFLENVRETVQKYGLDRLKYQLIWNLQSGRITSGHVGLNPVKNMFRRERVLIVLDDVDEIEHLKELAGEHSWFGPGSRIIIIARNKDLLGANVDEIYEVAGLNDYESRQLFYQHAFRDTEATDEFMNLSPSIVNHARGLPLVVKVLGSSLFEKSLSEWKNQLIDLNRNHWEVPDLLRICFVKLDAEQQKIFLDIACFFKGYDADYVAKYLDSCGISEEAGVKALCEKCFLSISDGRIWVHDLLQEMAHEIVRQQTKETAACCRLWDSVDVNHVLSENKGIENVEIMILDSSKINDVLHLPSVISEMPNLRLLKIFSSTNNGSNTPQVPHCRLKSNFIRYFNRFSDHLIYFQWEGYPLTYLPELFQPQNLVELIMPHGNLKKFPTIFECFDKLKCIDLSYSKNLIKTPNFSKTPNLEKLNLEGCTNLREVHSSIAFHKNLQMVNMKDCTSVCKFPSPIEMKALKFFSLSGCSKLQEFPEIRGNMECLLELHVDGTAIKRLPGSSKELRGLEVLCVEDRQDLNIFAAIGCSSKLKIIKVISGRKEESCWSKWRFNRYAAAATAMIGTVILV